jgi:hypothetical protein
MLKNSSVYITGGMGSFRNSFVPTTLAKYNLKDVWLSIPATTLSKGKWLGNLLVTLG